MALKKHGQFPHSSQAAIMPSRAQDKLSVPYFSNSNANLFDSKYFFLFFQFHTQFLFFQFHTHFSLFSNHFFNCKTNSPFFHYPLIVHPNPLFKFFPLSHPRNFPNFHFWDRGTGLPSVGACYGWTSSHPFLHPPLSLWFILFPSSLSTASSFPLPLSLCPQILDAFHFVPHLSPPPFSLFPLRIMSI